jgi:general secretion pathway protein C
LGAVFANLSRLLIHLIGAALACAQLAFWSIRVTTPPPAPAPAPLRAATTHDPDPVLLARAFGQIERVGPVISNIQLAGVFAAGSDSAAVFVVGDLPARAVRLGQEVAPGSMLVDVDPQSATLDSGGVRRQLQVPSPPVAGFTGPGPAGFERRGNVLTAPMVDTSVGARPAASPRAPANVIAPRAEPPPRPAVRGATPGAQTAR